jgi:hypothetical protein
VRADTDKPRMSGVSADPDISVRGRCAARSAPNCSESGHPVRFSVRHQRLATGQCVKVEAATGKSGVRTLVSRLSYRLIRGLQVGGFVALGGGRI